MATYRVSRTDIHWESAEVEATSEAEAKAAFLNYEWVGDIREEADVEWEVERVGA